MFKFIVLSLLLFSTNALDCQIVDGVTYVKIDGNWQPDGCPEKSSCVDKVCATETVHAQPEPVSSSLGYNSWGDACKVYYMPAHTTQGITQNASFIVEVPDGKGPNDKCGKDGNADGAEMKCLGDFGEDLMADCVADKSICEDPKKLLGSCQIPENFLMAAGWWTLFITLAIVILCVLWCAKSMGCCCFKPGWDCPWC
tara:strand:+ start:442 stop:1035 length:594 start_codon:yes stop_codon:yes gene_type:complete